MQAQVFPLLRLIMYVDYQDVRPRPAAKQQHTAIFYHRISFIADTAFIFPHDISASRSAREEARLYDNVAQATLPPFAANASERQHALHMDFRDYASGD